MELDVTFSTGLNERPALVGAEGARETEVTTWETVEIRELFALWQIVSLVAVHSSLITAPGSHCEQFKHSCS